MNPPKKWLFILFAIVFVGSMFADKIISFYIDILWFDHYQFLSVIWTILGAQFGYGIFSAALFFALTYGILKFLYNKTSHLPVVLSPGIRQDIPLLEFLAANLKPIILIGPLLISLMTGLIVAQQWEIIIKFMNHVPFDKADPIFNKDYSFYLFTLPFLEMVKALLWTALVVIVIGTGIIYFLKRFIYLTPTGFTILPEAQRTLSLLAAFAFLLLAVEFYLRRYGLLTSGNAVVEGIGYADYYGKLPSLFILIVFSFISAGVSLASMRGKGLRKIVISAIALGIIYLAGNFYPGLLKRFVVDPNELIKESPYIEHTIAGTRMAYGLDKVEENVLTGTASLNAESIRNNAATVENIRLWDQEPLLDTLGQIQEIRTYYQFASVDNDRYVINGKYRQTLLSPRELLSSSLPNRTWINEHLTFTHGYGISLSPVNHVTPQGLPVLFIKDIPPKSEVDLKVTQPEIYYGELTESHVFVKTGTKEFDYPEGEKNVYKNYGGQGGIQMGSFFRKILLAVKFKTMKILFSQDINSDSRLMIYRNIMKRVQKIAPFLRLDRDSYLVLTKEGRLVWMIDAYTTSDQFPYSQMLRFTDGPRRSQSLNYMRNSVKITVDAYEGAMNFYIADPEDPIILTYRNLFPSLFKDLSAMPEDLRNHIRYPLDLFSAQTTIFTTYHMKTPQVFYNKEDQWETPVIDDELMRPYFTIMKLPGKEKEEYILMLPFTPKGKQNLSAWMVARSDGQHYGKLVVYTFPKQKLIYGPSQIVARINQEAEISRQISLWDQRGSKVIQGNLLVIPIEESLIYVRPLYLKADAGRIPELKRVIVGYEDQIAMEPTLEGALNKIFSGLQMPESHAVETVATQPLPLVTAGGKDKIVLRQADYRKIKARFNKALEAQKKLDKALEGYRSDLKALGETLDSTQIESLPSESKEEAPPLVESE